MSAYNTMQYNDYIAEVFYDDSIGAFHGRVINLRDGITFEADSVEGLHREFAESVEDYLEWCRERGKEPEKPYSGKLILRIEPDLHRSLSNASSLEGTSLNALIERRLRESMERH